MKGLSAKDLRGNDPAELRSTLRKLEEDLFKNRLKKTTNQLENTTLIRNARRDIARVNTVLTERLRTAGGSPEGGSNVAKSAAKKTSAGGGAAATKEKTK
ncbi:MAG TPA: 50S ribosomal protein L29 [Polyangia bacterium]